MSRKSILKRLHALASKAKGGIVQDCPPELYACEVCGKLDCTTEVWLNCPQRLAAAQYMKTGDRQALTELKQLRIARDHALGCKLSTPDHDSESERPSGIKVPRIAT